MFDRDAGAEETLATLKRNRGPNRSRLIRKFIKQQLTSGKTQVYAYRESKCGAWVRTKPHESEHFRRNISPSGLSEEEISSNSRVANGSTLSNLGSYGNKKMPSSVSIKDLLASKDFMNELKRNRHADMMLKSQDQNQPSRKTPSSLKPLQ